MMRHLTDEQFAQLMAGDRSDAKALRHAESCATCLGELTAVGAAVGDLNHISLRWAERRAERIQAPSAWDLKWKALPGWAAAVMALLIFGVALGTHMKSSDETAVLETPQTMPAPTADELAQDNRLMRSIDVEINEQPGVQMVASGLRGSSHAGRRRALNEVSN